MNFLCSFVILISFLLPAVAQQKPAAAQELPENAGAALVYSQGGGFMLAGPKGWVTDREVGQRLGTCCVYYPESSTWDNADTVMYPSIATKGPGETTLKEFMSNDLEDFRAHNSEMTYEDSEDLALKDRRSAKIRYFYNVNRGSSEAVAYIDEEKIIAIFVMSSKTKKQLNENMPLFRNSLQTYVFMDVKIARDATTSKKQRPVQEPKD